MTKQEVVVLVNESDEVLGTMEKMQAHVEGKLHRAFSVFIFNSKGEMLIHQRALSKYHSPGLWTNTCCSHPRPQEAYIDGANRRLMEEMGMQCELAPAFKFIYKCSFDNNLIEHELDHVFTGISDEEPKPNKQEVHSWKYVAVEDLLRDIDDHPSLYTPWFKICLDAHVEQLLARA